MWLGSVCTDGRRLVSDGRDNCVLVHDFSEEAVTRGSDGQDQEAERED